MIVFCTPLLSILLFCVEVGFRNTLRARIRCFYRKHTKRFPSGLFWVSRLLLYEFLRQCCIRTSLTRFKLKNHWHEVWMRLSCFNRHGPLCVRTPLGKENNMNPRACSLRNSLGYHFRHWRLWHCFSNMHSQKLCLRYIDRVNKTSGRICSPSWPRTIPAWLKFWQPLARAHPHHAHTHAQSSTACKKLHVVVPKFHMTYSESHLTIATQNYSFWQSWVYVVLVMQPFHLKTAEQPSSMCSE